jgi:serine O-acetyltransferase
VNALTLYRLGNWAHRHGLRYFVSVITKLNYLIFKCYIPGSATVGRGSKIAYGGIAVVIHAHSKIGENCVIGQCVTLGAKEGYASSEVLASPVVEDNVYIAAGAKLIGGIKIGHSSIIAANAVVLHSFPPHSVLAGCPAKVRGRTEAGYLAIRPNGTK